MAVQNASYLKSRFQQGDTPTEADFADLIDSAFAAGPVASVAGKTGTVTLTTGDISGLGTAATKNTGTSANNVVALDGSAKLPAVDGSQLTNLPAAPVTSVHGRTGAITTAAADITNSTATGRAVLTATDAAAARSAIGAGTGNGSGDVTGPGSSTDNTLARFDGTGGKTVQGSGVVVSDANEISGFMASLNLQTGTTYTIAASDAGKIIDHANGSAIAVSLPNSLAVGFTCSYVQTGAGQVTFTAASGASLRHPDSHTKTAKQWAPVQLYVRSNAGGSAAEWVMTGYTAA